MRIYKISGHSMSPAFLPGDYVVSLSKTCSKPKVKDVIIFEHGIYGKMIKRIFKKTPNGFYVQGIHAMSTKSETIGVVTNESIIGKVVFKFAKRR